MDAQKKLKKSSSTTSEYLKSRDYTLISKIGRGTFGVVWKAKNIKTNKIVAIK